MVIIDILLLNDYRLIFFFFSEQFLFVYVCVRAFVCVWLCVYVLWTPTIHRRLISFIVVVVASFFLSLFLSFLFINRVISNHFSRQILPHSHPAIIKPIFINPIEATILNPYVIRNAKPYINNSVIPDWISS